MATVETARGPIESKQLGRTLMHEHVFVLSTEIQLNYPQEWGVEDDRIADAVTRLNDLKAAGIDTILDPTAIGLGRYVPRIAAIAEQMGVTLQNTSLSANVKERLDFSCALFDPAGDLVVNAPHIPVHLGAMSECVKRLMEDASGLRAGDVSLNSSTITP